MHLACNRVEKYVPKMRLAAPSLYYITVIMSMSYLGKSHHCFRFSLFLIALFYCMRLDQSGSIAC